ncbi:MAG: acyltransferase family protein [Muribaculaceae bacterium]
MATVGKQRIHHFDMLKGVAMFMVVMGHVLAFCVREIDRATIFKVFEQVHMPLFFFVSGWFTYKLDDRGRLILPKLAQRAVRLLLPMVAVSSIWVWYFPHSGVETPFASTFEELWTSAYKNGYWFTLVLFEIVLLYAAIRPLLNRCRQWWASAVVIAAVFAVLYWLNGLSGRVGEVMSLGMITAYAPVFFAGLLARRYRDGFERLADSSTAQTVSILVASAAIYAACWPWEAHLEGSQRMFAQVVAHPFLALVAYRLFRDWGTAAFAPEASPVARGIARMWEYIGTQSLGIYLLHYFFLFPMGSVVRGWMTAMNVAWVPLGAFAALMAACIVAMVLIVIKIIKPSKLLSLLLAGNK